MKWIPFVACLVLVAFAGVAAAEEIDNPGYASWARYKVGAKVEYKTVQEMMGNKTETTMSYELVELTDEKAVIELKSSTVMMGQTMESPPQRMDIPARYEVQEGEEPEGEEEGEEPETTEGTESIEAGGRKFDAKWTQMVMTTEAGTTTTKMWSSPDVPGELVKQTMTMDSPQMKMTSETVLVSVQAEPK